jgi:hypothetical protein
MKFSALAISSVFAASSAFAGFMSTATLSATSEGAGQYLISGNTWTINFYTDADLSQSGADADFGNWILTVTGTNGKKWSTSNSETFGGTYRNVTGARIFTVDLANGEGGELSGTGDLTPVPGKLSLKFTTPKSNSSSFKSMEDALIYSGSTTTTSQRGMLTVTSADGASVITGFFATTVPAPGAAALVGLAGLIVSRRRA